MEFDPIASAMEDASWVAPMLGERMDRSCPARESMEERIRAFSPLKANSGRPAQPEKIMVAKWAIALKLNFPKTTLEHIMQLAMKKGELIRNDPNLANAFKCVRYTTLKRNITNVAKVAWAYICVGTSNRPKKRPLQAV